MKISFGKTVISPEIGTCVAGYGTRDVSIAKLDDLYVTALALDDGAKKGVILGFDLLGIDEAYIERIRQACAKTFGGSEEQVICSCTHTHTGPHTRSHAARADALETEYLEALIVQTASLVASLMAQEWLDVDAYFYSLSCDANTNRRFVTGNNACSFLPHRRDMERIADGFADKELGGLFFMRRDNGQPAYVIGNFAAHPLAGHCPGVGGHRISADYPGFFRKYIEEETGAGCMFLSGACGDMVPKGDETGRAAIEAMGTKLAQATLAGMIIATRDKEHYRLKEETLQFGFKHATAPVREFRKPRLSPNYKGRTEMRLPIQLFSVGDVCLVGVPGELVAELGQEIKWHSPFRRTFILYCSTAYMDYLCHGNALVAGGYEGREQYTDSHTGLKLVNAAVEGAYELYARTYPDVSKWPESSEAPLVSLVNI